MSPNAFAIRAAGPARWMLVAGIAYSLASTVLYFLSGPQDTGGDERGAGESSAAASRTRAAIDLDALLSRNLFGAVDAEAAAAQAAETPTVATRLPLELRGVFVADVAEESVAIISQKGKAGELYTVGDKLPGNATLVDVQSDHVVLRRAGVREALHFPDLTGSGWTEPVPDQSPLSNDDAPLEDRESIDAEVTGIEDNDRAAESGSVAELLTDIRERVDADPEGTLEALGISPVDDGGSSGYRLDDLAQSPYLSQTGLQPGDVILSVNGRPVGDLNQDRLEIDNVLAQGSARLEVQRGNRRFFVTASLR